MQAPGPHGVNSMSLLCGHSGAEGGDLTPGMVQEDQSSWRSGLKRLGRVIRGPCRPLYRTAHEYGPPWCRCTLPEPGWLREEHAEPWHTVDKALILGGPESETPLFLLFFGLFLACLFLGDSARAPSLAG